MARRKGQSSKAQRSSGKKKKNRATLDWEDNFVVPPGLPSRRLLDSMMSQLVGTMDEGEPDSPASAAQQLIYEAFECDDSERRVQLALQALAISPDCADAYTLLGEECHTEDEAVDYFQQAVAAGERSLGDECFEEYAGHFWGVFETRPYMRARLELANSLWHRGQKSEATEHYRQLLRLNPNDNQGVRYLLAGCLFELELHEELATLLKEYEDDGSADWCYLEALLWYTQEGDSPQSRELLRTAAAMNPHVPAYLLGHRHIPGDLPEYVGRGDQSEAAAYAAHALRHWKATPGSIPWMRETLQVTAPSAKPRRRGAATWRLLCDRLQELPQDGDEVWHVDIRRVSQSRQADEDDCWLLVATSPSRERVVASEPLPEKPSGSHALMLLGKVMIDPADEQPRRPTAIHVRLKTQCTAWQKKLAQVDIDCVQVPELEDVDAVVEGMVESYQRHTQLHDGAAATDEELLTLPQLGGETWQVGVQQLASWVGTESSPERPWIAIAFNATEDLILEQNVQGEYPDDAWPEELLRRAMSFPAIGEPHRPGVVEICQASVTGNIVDWLANLEIECRVTEALGQLDDLFEDVVRNMDGDEAPSAMLDTPGVEERHVSGLFAAAANFHREKPWRLAPSDSPICVECENFKSGPWYGVVMGQMGMAEGIALYDDLAVLRRILAGALSDEEHARLTSSLALYFNEAFEIGNVDLANAERYGWEVASPEAYPSIMRVNPGMSIRAPLAWEIQLMEACLRAIPVFLSQDKESPIFTVPTAEGETALQLSWQR